MAIETIIQRTERLARERGLEPLSKDSMNWFMRKAQGISRGTVRTELVKKGKQKRGLPGLGRMYFYQYDAKTKDTLPYWDKYPLILLVDIHENGTFSGLNVHYLPPKLRAILFDNLLDLRTNKKHQDSVRLRLTYALLKGITKYKFFAPCFKKYLFSQLRSPLIEIPFTEWEATIFLPIQEFQKASSSVVWSDSVLKVK